MKDYKSTGIAQKYIYEGPILVFGSVKDQKWRAETTATSKAEARRNFEYRAKKHLGLLPSTMVKLPNEISKA